MDLVAEGAERNGSHQNANNDAKGKKTAEGKKAAGKPARIPQPTRGVAVERSQFG
jgi:hypothetical protein